MQITAERSSLLKTLLRTTRIVEKRNTIPILANLLLVATYGMLTIKGTDLDMEITDSLPCDVQLDGKITVPAALLSDIAKKLPAGSTLKIVTADDGASVTVTSGRSSYKLQVLPAQDYPDMNAGHYTHSFQMTGVELLRLIDRTAFAMSTEETRYYLNGVFLHAPVPTEGSEARLVAVATDGHKLSKVDMPLPAGAEGMPGIIIPRKVILELQKLADVETIRIQVSDAKVHFDFGAFSLMSKLIDGTFPDYMRVIPRDNPKELTVERLIFAAASDRVSTISSERGRAVKIDLTDGQMVITVSSPDAGVATEAVSVIYSDDEFSIGFNAKYLAEAMAVLQGDQVIVRLNDPGSPALIRGSGDADALVVVMPMRV